MTGYRTHTCNELTVSDVGETVKLAGWIHRKRDHGNLLFIDLRDNYGITQCVVSASAPAFSRMEPLRLESVVSVTGKVAARSPETVNPHLTTGSIELVVESAELLSAAEPLPFQVNGTQENIPEEQRLRYRFLDLRRERLHRNIVLRSKVIASLRRRMTERGFTEFQTPILTSS